jgi:nitrite reductase (NADH) small subunit
VTDKMSGKLRWVRTARCEDIPLREARSVRFGEREIAIFNLGDRFLAIDNRCPHKGGPLSDGIVSGSTVACPLHTRKVDLETGNVLNTPDSPQCVAAFRARVEDGVIFLELPVKSAAKENRPGVCFEGSVQILGTIQSGM